jgi:hypothetical protein
MMRLTKKSWSCAALAAAPTCPSCPRAIALGALERYENQRVEIVLRVCERVACECAMEIAAKGCTICHQTVSFWQGVSLNTPNRLVSPNNENLVSSLLFTAIYYLLLLLQAGLCCCNLQCCCKAGAPLLVPCGMVGIRPECDGLSCVNAQCHACCVVFTAAIPCNKEVPLAVSVLGLTMFPKCGFLLKQKEIMNRD